MCFLKLLKFTCSPQLSYPITVLTHSMRTCCVSLQLGESLSNILPRSCISPCPHVLMYSAPSQHISTYLNISQHISKYLNMSQHISTHLNISQHISKYLNISQHISIYLNISQHISTYLKYPAKKLYLALSTCPLNRVPA